jgi:hypothetical protein
MFGSFTACPVIGSHSYRAIRPGGDNGLELIGSIVDGGRLSGHNRKEAVGTAFADWHIQYADSNRRPQFKPGIQLGRLHDPAAKSDELL